MGWPTRSAPRWRSRRTCCQAADAPHGTTPTTWTLQVNSAGAVTSDPAGGRDWFACRGRHTGRRWASRRRGTAAGAPVIIGGPTNAVGVHTATDSINSAVAAGGLLQFDTVDNDAGGFAPTGSPFNHVTIPAGLGGVYSLVGSASVAGDSTMTVGMGVLVNGVQVYATTNQSMTGTSAVGVVTLSYSLSCVAAQHLSLAAGDTVQLRQHLLAGAERLHRCLARLGEADMTVHPYHRKLARVLDRMGGLYVLNDILTEIAQGRMQSFVEDESWALTRVAQYPRAKVVEVLAVVGRLDKARVLHDRILVFAAEIGAGIVMAYGRSGWMPDAEKRGWKIKTKNYVYQKEM